MSGLIYFIAMVVAASLTQLMSVIDPIWSVALVTVLIATEFYMFGFCCRVPTRSEHEESAQDSLLGGTAAGGGGGGGAAGRQT